MKVKYKFNNGDVTEVEVSKEIGAMIIDSRREEESAERKHRRHCYSMEPQRSCRAARPACTETHPPCARPAF